MTHSIWNWLAQIGFIPSLTSVIYSDEGYRHLFVYQMNEKTSVLTFQWSVKIRTSFKQALHMLPK